MKIRVLGCSGAIARDCRTTSFLVDHDILLDAGTGVGDLTLDEMLGIEDVLITHSHLDHIAALPLMVDAIGSRLTRPLRILALPQTIEALKAHVFNNIIWPDFSRIPTPEQPFIRFEEIHVGQLLEIRGRRIEVLPAVHTVPAVGYAVSAGAGHPAWVYTGDTGPNPALWQRLRSLRVRHLVIETTFRDDDHPVASASRHLHPAALGLELAQLAEGAEVHITHVKPGEMPTVMAEIGALDPRHRIRALAAGQVMVLA